MRPVTEQVLGQAQGLDVMPLPEAAALLAGGQAEAATAPQAACTAIAAAAQAMAQTLRGGGRLIYAAAGSSGLMAAADAMELGGTYGIPASQIRILMAGGLPTDAEMLGEVEDDVDSLRRDLADLSSTDTVIALSASGTTLFTLAAVDRARAAGATVIGIANNPDAPLLARADHPILLATPPEVISGSTRMGAGTAQKIALNMLSTVMAIDLGHVHDGMMVNLRADNAKLRARARTMVARIASVSEGEADRALSQTAGAVKPAVLVAAGATKGQAEAWLAASQGHLRKALEQQKTNDPTRRLS